MQTASAGNRRSGKPSQGATRRWCLVASMLLCVVVVTGCAGKTEVVYLTGGDEIVHLEAGVPAPFAGWLMTDERLAEIFDLLEEGAGEVATP